MLPNRFVLGVLAGLIVSAVGLIFAVARKEQMVAVFMQPEPGGEGMSKGTATAMLFASMGLFGPILGVLAALVYGWVPSRTVFSAWRLGWRRCCRWPRSSAVRRWREPRWS